MLKFVFQLKHIWKLSFCPLFGKLHLCDATGLDSHSQIVEQDSHWGQLLAGTFTGWKRASKVVRETCSRVLALPVLHNQPGSECIYFLSFQGLFRPGVPWMMQMLLCCAPVGEDILWPSGIMVRTEAACGTLTLWNGWE